MEPRKYQKEITDYIYEYVRSCKDTWNIVHRKDIKKLNPFADRIVDLPSFRGFLLFLIEEKGITISTKIFYEWRNNEFADKEEWNRFMDAVQYLDLKQYVKLQNGALSGAYNKGTAALLLKKNHGMGDDDSDNNDDKGNQTVNIIIKKDDAEGYDIQSES